MQAWLQPEAKRDASRLAAWCDLFKDRCDTLCVLAEWINRTVGPVNGKPEDLAQHVTDAVKPALAAFAQGLKTVNWTAADIAALIKSVLQAHQLKMPQLAMPVRVLVLGTPQTPSLDQVLALSDRARVVALIEAGL